MEERVVSICERIIFWSFYTLIFLTPLLVCPWTHELFEFPKMMFVYAVTTIIAAAFLVKLVLESRHTKYDIRNTIYRNPLTLPISIYLLSFILSTLFSTHPHTSIFGYYSRFHGGLLSLICYISLFYIYIAEFRQKPKKVLVTCYLLLVTAFLVSLYGVLQHFGIDKDYWIQDSQARVFSTLGQPNWLAAWLLMILPLSWALYFSSKRLLPVTCYLLLSVALFAAFWFTYSLSGILGFLVVVAAFAILVPKVIFLENKKRILLLVTSYLLLVTFRLGLFAPRIRDVWDSLTVVPPQNEVAAFRLRFERDVNVATSLDEVAPTRRDDSFGLTGFSLLPAAAYAAEAPPSIPGGDTAQIRNIVWQGALNLWKSSPKNILLGTGPETFAYAFLPFRPTALNQTSEWDFLYNKSHNEYIDILCGTGILGLGAYLFLVGRFLWWGTRKIFNSQFSISKNTKYLILNTRYLLPALLSGWVSLLVTNFFGFSVVPTALLFWLYPAICFSLPKGD